jgi:predicted protein tyrosine phosphatase
MNTVNHYTDFTNAEKYARDYHAAISLGHFLPEKFRESQKYLFLDFQDFDFIDLEIDPTNAKFAPNAEHVQQLVDFIRELSPTDKLLIHCLAGYSRSPAGVMIAKCERDGKTLNLAKEELYNARIPDKLTPKPNPIMIHQYLMIK